MKIRELAHLSGVSGSISIARRKRTRSHFATASMVSSWVSSTCCSSPSSPRDISPTGRGRGPSLFTSQSSSREASSARFLTAPRLAVLWREESRASPPPSSYSPGEPRGLPVGPERAGQAPPVAPGRGGGGGGPIPPPPRPPQRVLTGQRWGAGWGARRMGLEQSGCYCRDSQPSVASGAHPTLRKTWQVFRNLPGLSQRRLL